MEQRSEDRRRGTRTPLKLPLAPIVSISPDKRRQNSTVSTRRGISIFTPPQRPPVEKHPTSAQISSPTITGPSNSKNPPPPPAAAACRQIKYKECQKNHAAGIGGHLVDGCGEFMPRGDDGSPNSLKCTVCNCHRNFHRKEVNPRQSSYNSHRLTTSPPSPIPPNHSHESRHFAGAAGLRVVNFGGGVAVESCSYGGNASKKRFRTKFSREQKDLMNKFGRKLGWRIEKQEEEEVERFCSEVGVKREVFKVWMNNSKQAIKRRASMV